MPLLLLALLGFVIVELMPSIARASVPAGELEDNAQLPDVIDEANAAFSNALDSITGAGDDVNADANVAAFLSMIAISEGTAGPNGYRTLFGGSLFNSFADHPRTPIRATLKSGALTSTAAGRYQFLERTWDEIATKLGLADFSPGNQDLAAIELIRQRGALGDVQTGRFETAVQKVRKVWASLPGAGYNQPENSLAVLRGAYINAGGTIA